MKPNKAYRLSELTEELNVVIKGDPDCIINGIATIQRSAPGQITFLTNPLYRKHLTDTQASAVILTEADAPLCPVNAVISSNPYYIYAKIASYFVDAPTKNTGLHPSCSIGDFTDIHPTASIGPNCAIGSHVSIGANVVIGPNCVIEDDVKIGENSHLDGNVTVYRKVTIGKRAIIASGVVIGSEGFGFANQSGTWHKVPQLGSVEIGDDVDIGANTAIDRGAIDNTVIEDGVKLDNLIQIGHNVRIGSNSIIAGCVGIAGSTTIGKNCMIGGACCIVGHIVICDNVIITGMSGIEKSINQSGVYSSGVGGVVPIKEFRKNNARFHRLDKLTERVKNIESMLRSITERNDA